MHNDLPRDIVMMKARSSTHTSSEGSRSNRCTWSVGNSHFKDKETEDNSVPGVAVGNLLRIQSFLDSDAGVYYELIDSRMCKFSGTVKKIAFEQ